MMTSLALALVLLQEPRQQEEPPLTQEQLAALMLDIEGRIESARGLKFKEHVKMKVVPRPQGQDKGIRALYSFQDKAIQVYDDIGKTYAETTLAHEMVHALDDQYFNLSRMHRSAFTGDSQMAVTALIEGDASYTMVLVDGGKTHVSKIMDTPIEQARNLQGNFVYAQGARFVKAIREKYGWEGVNNVFNAVSQAAYTNTPFTTAQILNLAEPVQTVNLGVGDSVGAYGVLSKFFAVEETKPLSVKLAAGWRGDLVTGDKNASTWTVAFSTKEGAMDFASAMTVLKTVKNPSLESVYEEPGAGVWRTEKGGVQAVMVRGDRAYVVEANNDETFKVLLDRLEGAAQSMLVWSTADQRQITYGEMIDRLLKADIICVGEQHATGVHQRVELQIVKALFAADESLGVGMEMFFRPFQKEIDRYIEGRSTEAQFLERAEYKRWGFDWKYYRPVVDFCRKNRVPLAGLNAVSEMTNRIRAVGFEGLTEDEKGQLGDIDTQVQDHRAYWFPRLKDMHSQIAGRKPVDQEHSYQVMCTWDEYMGASAAMFQESRFLRRMVVLAGQGHTDYGWGIAARAAKRTGGKAMTVHIAVGGLPMEQEIGRPLADFVVIIK